MNGFKQTSQPERNLQTIAQAVCDAVVECHFISISGNYKMYSSVKGLWYFYMWPIMIKLSMALK